MKLLNLRTKLVQISGHYELVTDAAAGDYSDNGADFFIYEGQKYLDRLDETQKSWATCLKFVNVNSFSVIFPYCRSIKEVWAASATEGRWQLEKMDLQDLMATYLTETPAEIESGTPLYYSPIGTRFIPEGGDFTSFEDYIGAVQVLNYEALGYNSLILNVPTDEKIALQIVGLFYTAELVDDNDRNHWSVSHPLLLIMAAQRAIHISNGNKYAADSLEASIKKEAAQLGMDLVEELNAEVSQIEG